MAQGPCKCSCFRCCYGLFTWLQLATCAYSLFFIGNVRSDISLPPPPCLTAGAFCFAYQASLISYFWSIFLGHFVPMIGFAGTNLVQTDFNRRHAKSLNFWALYFPFYLFLKTRHCFWAHFFISEQVLVFSNNNKFTLVLLSFGNWLSTTTYWLYIKQFIIH